MALQPVGKTDALKCRIESPLGYILVRQCCKDFFRDGITAGKVINLDGGTVHGNTEEQYLKIIRLSVLIGTAFPDIYVAVSLQVD